MPRPPRRSPKPQRSRSTPKSPRPSPTTGERLQKVLAAAGLGSRRDCEEWIQQGRVEVDGQIVTELGTRVEPHQQIRVDGVALTRHRREYYLLNKPVNVLCTNFDPSGRTRVIDLLPGGQRLFTVGRLDRASEGLILVTNDGELANRLTHPRYEVEKTYLVRVAGLPSAEILARLRKGVWLAEGLARVAAITIRRQHHLSTDLEIVLKEGKNREIRRILARVGHKVLSLKRIAMGPLRLANLASGEFRRLTPAEVRELQEAASGAGRSRRPRVGERAADAAENAPKQTAPPKTRLPKTTARYVASQAKPVPGELADWEAELYETPAPSDVPDVLELEAESEAGPEVPPSQPRRQKAFVRDTTAAPKKGGPFRGTVLGYGEPRAEKRSTRSPKKPANKSKRTDRRKRR